MPQCVHCSDSAYFLTSPPSDWADFGRMGTTERLGAAFARPNIITVVLVALWARVVTRVLNP
jgi:hypothetical protein